MASKDEPLIAELSVRRQTNRPLTAAERREVVERLDNNYFDGWLESRLRRAIARLDELEPPESEQ